VKTVDPNPVRATLAANLRKMRLERNLSQEALADLAGIHRNYLGGIERCERNVGLDNLHKLATALGVAVAELTS
jgi:transcriptional regulator with XRE-family HTH domain